MLLHGLQGTPNRMIDGLATAHAPELIAARPAVAEGIAKAPANPQNRYVTVVSDHPGTPDAAREVVLAWLKELR